MKKTLVALAVAAFATSASALTVYEQDGAKVDFNGSLRLRLDQESSKTTQAGVTTKKRAHTNLHNDGSRFGVTAKYDLADDFYALGRVEFRFDDEATGSDKFGDLYAKRAYVGLGSKQYGEVTFGRQILIGDDIAQSGFDNAYGTFDTTLETASDSAVRYDYKGVDGLQVGLSYRFANKRDANNEVKEGAQKSGYDFGTTYNFKVAEGRDATVAAGYSRTNYKVAEGKHHKDAYAFGAKYKVDALTLGADYAGAFEKNGNERGRLNGLRVGAKYDVTPAVAVYGNYGYYVAKTKHSGTNQAKTVGHKYMLGAQYSLHKNVFTYVEGGLHKAKTTSYVANTPAVKQNDKNIGVGLRVHW